MFQERLNEVERPIWTMHATDVCIYYVCSQNESEHCLLLALPCGRDAGDVRAQTHALKNSLISYLLQKQAAGIINVPGSQVNANSCSVQCFLHYACEMITHSDNLQGSLPWGVGQGFRRV